MLEGFAKYFFESYDKWADGRTNVTATIAVFRKQGTGIEVLVGKRKKAPMIGAWALPGGHVEEKEKPEEGARRELWEETGVKVHYLMRVHEKMPSVQDRAISDVLFCAVIDPKTPLRCASDCGGLKWVNIGKLPELAFQHERYVFDAAAKLFGTRQTIQEVVNGLDDVLFEQEEKEDMRQTLHRILSKKPKKTKGLLVVFEGIDGAGKSSQTENLSKWLKKQGYKVAETSWNSSSIIKPATKKAKEKRLLSPMLYCLMHAADMVERYENVIEPALAQNKIVICDRYYYTSLVRDESRGIDTEMVSRIYENFRQPDVLFHCACPIHTAFGRLMKEKGLSYYGTGMDLNLADSREENYIKYENILDKLYKKELPQVPSYHRLNMAKSIDAIFDDIKKVMGDKFGIGKYGQDD